MAGSIFVLAVSVAGSIARRALVGLGRDDQPVHFLHAEFAVDELRRQPVEQLRVRGQSAEHTEIARRLLQALAKVPLPQAIDGHPGEEADSRAPSASRQSLRSGRRGNRAWRREGPAGLDGLVLLGPIGFTAGEDVARFLLASAVDFDGPERRQWRTAARVPPPSAASCFVSSSNFLRSRLGQEFVDLDRDRRADGTK